MGLRTDGLLEILEGIAPALLAEEWDNIGLLLGHPAEKVQGILIGLDPAPDLLSQASALGCNTIITHHPAIFRPLKRLTHDLPQAQLLRQATLTGMQLIGCHTNLDNAHDGVSDLLATTLGLADRYPLVPARDSAGAGMGRIGTLPRPLSPEDFLALIASTLSPPWLLTAGHPSPRIERVALCGGSGSNLTETAWRLGAQVYLTAEVKHADACWAEDAGIWLLDAGHFATEHPIVPALSCRLQRALRDAGHETPVHIAREQPPLRLLSSGNGPLPHFAASGEHA